MENTDFPAGDTNFVQPLPDGLPTSIAPTADIPVFSPAPMETSASDVDGADPDAVSRILSVPLHADVTKRPMAATTNHRWNPPSAKKAPTGTAQSPAPTSLADTAADIGKTVASQGALGFGDIAAVPATVNQLWQKASQIINGLGAKGAEAIGVAPKGSAETAITLAKQQSAEKQSATDKSGDTSSIFGWEAPTAQKIEKGLVKGFPSLGYSPETRVAKVIGSGARAIPMVAGDVLAAPFTGGASLAAIPATAAGLFASGAVSELAGEATEGTPYEPYARIAGSLIGGPLVGKAASFAGAITPVAQEATATRALTRALAQDQASGTAPMTMKQVATVPGAGLWNAAGPNTKALVQRLSTTPHAQDAVLQLNQMAAAQKAAASANIAGHISDTLGLDQSPFDLQSAIKKGNADNVNNLYQTMGNSSQAQAVTSPILDRLSQSDTIQSLGKKAASVATDPDSRIVAPTDTTPGNIFYWDQIKQGLDDGYSVAQRTGENGEARRLMGLKKQLVGELDTQVPGYADARGAAADSFGAQNAVEAGYNLAAKKANNFSAGQVQKTFSNLNPQQQAMFAQGAGGYLKEVGLNNGPDQVIKAMTDTNKAPILQTALGADNYNSILGGAYNESFLKNARTLSVGVGEPPSTMDQVFNANALLEAPNALGHLILSGNPLPLGGLIASKTAEGLIGSYKSAADQAQAKTVLNLLGTQDPKKLAQLGKMISSSPKNQGFFYGLGNALRRATVRAVVANPPNQSQTNPAQAPDTSPNDLDAVTRTIAAEAGNQGPTGMSAVAHTILNRSKASGESLGQVVQRPHAFEAVGNGSAAKVDPDSGSYKAAHEALLSALANDNDPTGGATYYLNKGLQTALGRPIPSWAQGDGVKIGDHTFYAGGYGAPDNVPLQRKSGGRAENLSFEDLVSRLMKAAKTAKKQEDKTTRPLLNLPDSLIVKALHVAQKAI